MDNESLIYFFGFLFICFLIFMLCVYKIAVWFKQPENTQKVRKAIGDMNDTPPVFRKISRIRMWLAVGLLVVILISWLASFWLTLPRETLAAFFILSIVISIVFNNVLVGRLWRCPRCHSRLPVTIRRGGNAPKLIKSCPHCHFEIEIKYGVK